MKAFLFIIVSLLASVSTMAQNTKFDIEADLQRLDSVVANSANYDRQKQQNINLIKRSAGTYVTPTERYNFYKRMYRVHEVRQRFGKTLCVVVPGSGKPADMPNLEVSAMFDRAYIMILCGELIDAQRILNHISTPVENMLEDVQMWRHRARLQLCHAVHRFRLPPTVLRPSSAYMPSSAWASPTASA